ncbi:unnamed protein product, partial [marine sediment metagenome]
QAANTKISVKRTDATAFEWGMWVESGAGRIYNFTDSASFMHFAKGGAVTFYYNNAGKFRTAVGGVNVTGNMDADTVTINDYTLPAADGTNGQWIITNGSGTLSWAGP